MQHYDEALAFTLDEAVDSLTLLDLGSIRLHGRLKYRLLVIGKHKQIESAFAPLDFLDAAHGELKPELLREGEA